MTGKKRKTHCTDEFNTWKEGTLNAVCLEEAGLANHVWILVLNC